MTSSTLRLSASLRCGRAFHVLLTKLLTVSLCEGKGASLGAFTVTVAQLWLSEFFPYQLSTVSRRTRHCHHMLKYLVFLLTHRYTVGHKNMPIDCNSSLILPIFTARRNSWKLFQRCICHDRIRPSVCPSVRHIPVFCRDEWSYDHAVFTDR